ncbi:MAG: DUF3656 domain-containing protein [Kiritimatiellia bacterium]
MNDIELLSPAGSFETALVAFAAGADAVYLGLDAFSARAEAANFTAERLRDLLGRCRQDPDGAVRKVYVAFNTLIDDADLPAAVERLALLDDLRPDGLIVQDLGVARLVRRHFPALALHASTQLAAHNLEGVLALKELGFTRVVLARELSLAEIGSIARRAGVEIEVFVHGALCYSVSGLCLFSAMERNRSGNRGRCAYCCRLPYLDARGRRSLPFSMRDLRLDDSLDALREAGVASLKIEGRMKSPVYVASVTRRYRELLDGGRVTVSRADLETVFSRRTTSLYLRQMPAAAETQAREQAEQVIDPASLGHLGTPIGTVKRLTRDREGRTWLRFHTARALERHDGLQFLAEGARPMGFGIGDMRTALSRATVFSVRAGSDVEVLVPPDAGLAIEPGATVFCAASNEVRRRFPVPSFRPSDYPAGTPVAVRVRLAADGIAVRTDQPAAAADLPCALAPARHPERTEAAVKQAFARLGGTAWRLDSLTLDDPERLFVPASLLNDARRRLVDALDRARAERRHARIEAALAADWRHAAADAPASTLKIRLDQPLPPDVCSYGELVIGVGHAAGREIETKLVALCGALRARAAEAGGESAPPLRLALPVFTHEPDFNALRAAVKHMAKAGMAAWEAADLATLRLLREQGLDDITADWTIYAFNRAALAQVADMGVRRIVASPESTPENLEWLARQPVAVEFLSEQSTPLFISLTRPAVDDCSRLADPKGGRYAAYVVDGLWVTSRAGPRTFAPPAAAGCRRVDRSWDA